MEIATLIFVLGQILLGGYFLFNGVMHFLQFSNMVGYAASKGVPIPTFSVLIASTLILLGGAGILLGIFVTWALYALIIFMIPVTLYMHAFWKVSDPNEKRIERIQFLKNAALTGALIMLLGLPTPWPVVIF